MLSKVIWRQKWRGYNPTGGGSFQVNHSGKSAVPGWNTDAEIVAMEMPPAHGFWSSCCGCDGLRQPEDISANTSRSRSVSERSHVRGRPLTAFIQPAFLYSLGSPAQRWQCPQWEELSSISHQENVPLKSFCGHSLRSP